MKKQVKKFNASSWHRRRADKLSAAAARRPYKFATEAPSICRGRWRGRRTYLVSRVFRQIVGSALHSEWMNGTFSNAVYIRIAVTRRSEMNYWLFSANCIVHHPLLFHCRTNPVITMCMFRPNVENHLRQSVSFLLETVGLGIAAFCYILRQRLFLDTDWWWYTDSVPSNSSQFIHSFILAISIAPLQVLYDSESFPKTARILYRSLTPKRTCNSR